MNDSKAHVETTVRIPGSWSNPGELVDRLPTGYIATEEGLQTPEGCTIAIAPLPPDNQFPDIFRSSCRILPTDDELRRVRNYTVNIGMIGPGGSRGGALDMMKAVAAILRAGGAGVFIDNSAVAHGASQWLKMVEDGGPDALSFAYVGIVAAEAEVRTMGMHVLGFPDVILPVRGTDADPDVIVEVIRYFSASEVPVDDGHILAVDTGPRYQVFRTSNDQFAVDSPMHNPYGRLKLVDLKDVARDN